MNNCAVESVDICLHTWCIKNSLQNIKDPETGAVFELYHLFRTQPKPKRTLIHYDPIQPKCFLDFQNYRQTFGCSSIQLRKNFCKSALCYFRFAILRFLFMKGNKVYKTCGSYLICFTIINKRNCVKLELSISRTLIQFSL